MRWNDACSRNVAYVGKVLMRIGSSSHVGISRPTVTTLVTRLEPGDRLAHAEFMRRYEATPEVKKAELIEGVGYMPSPVRMDVNGSPHAILCVGVRRIRRERLPFELVTMRHLSSTTTTCRSRIRY